MEIFDSHKVIFVADFFFCFLRCSALILLSQTRVKKNLKQLKDSHKVIRVPLIYN